MGEGSANTVKRIGRYEVLGSLATGGMAEIFLGCLRGPSGFERPVVVKRILPHLSRQRVFTEMFLDEARIVSQLRHPNVVQVQELGQDAGDLFLVMEYLEGESLAALIRRLARNKERLDGRLAAHIIAQSCAGLHSAHELTDPDGNSLEVVHRDVSPQNLFVLYTGQVKVLDFGIAKATDRIARTQTGHVKGKFAYMAPEQCRAEPLDRRADVFALGVILHELVTGKRLFARPNDLLILKAICDERIPPPSEERPGCAPEFDSICARALAQDRNDRYATVAEMRRELATVVRDMTGSGEPEEDLASLMRRLFADRVAQKKELLRRIRAGGVVTEVPIAEAEPESLPDGSGPVSAQPVVDLKTESPVHTETEAPGKRRRRSWIPAAAGLSVLGIGAAVFFTRPAPESAPASAPPVAVQKPPPEAQKTAETSPARAPAAPNVPAEVAVEVSSTPTSARVMLDGEEQGLTPITLHLARASQAMALEIKKDGFSSAKQRLVPDVDQRLQIALTPAARGGGRPAAKPADKPAGGDGFQRFD